jgi:hypothetical protein
MVMFMAALLLDIAASLARESQGAQTREPPNALH